MTPGEADYASDEVERARQALTEARALIAMESLAGAASRLYYAAFHASRAALAVRGLHARTHSGQISLFIETFGQAPILSRLLQVRGEADYGRKRFAVDADSLSALVDEADDFLQRCTEIVSEAAEAGPDEPDPQPDL